MATIVEERAVVTGVRIIVSPSGNRLLIEAVTQDASGNTIRYFSEDVTDSLTANQQTTVDGIAARAQQWADSKL